MENEVLDILSMSYDSAVKAVMDAFGMDKSAAEFFVSISRGDIEGDFVGVIVPTGPDEPSAL